MCCCYSLHALWIMRLAKICHPARGRSRRYLKWVGWHNSVFVEGMKVLISATDFLQTPNFSSFPHPCNKCYLQLKGMGLCIRSVHMTMLDVRGFALCPAANLSGFVWWNRYRDLRLLFLLLTKYNFFVVAFKEKILRNGNLIKLELSCLHEQTENLQPSLSEIWPGHLFKWD